MQRIDRSQHYRIIRIREVNNMNTTAIPAAKISAMTDHDRFEELLIVAGVVPGCEHRSIRIGNVVDESSVTRIGSLNSNITFRKNIGKFQISGTVTSRRNLRSKPDLLSL